MRDYINIGSSPYDEQCAQVGVDGYEMHALAECGAYCKQLIRQFPKAKCKFIPKSFEHDFGTYYEVVATYDENDDQARADALRAESEAPERWDKEARDELRDLLESRAVVKAHNDIVNHFRDARL